MDPGSRVSARTLKGIMSALNTRRHTAANPNATAHVEEPCGPLGWAAVRPDVVLPGPGVSGCENRKNGGERRVVAVVSRCGLSISSGTLSVAFIFAMGFSPRTGRTFIFSWNALHPYLNKSRFCAELNALNFPNFPCAVRSRLC
jgi:hypothetical protein